MNQIEDFYNKGNYIFFNKLGTVTVNESSDYNINPSEMVLSMGDNYMFAISMKENNFTRNPSYNVTFEHKDAQTFENGTRIVSENFIDLQPCILDNWKNLGNGVDWE